MNLLVWLVMLLSFNIKVGKQELIEYFNQIAHPQED